ncbi:hypothetical protein DPMN_034323 [Dreissena polymorpha]|uniref:Uncharacterized protein n=1 Tax=Dreissena polymorpha TaxID=45954 RepID=A0A9D4M7B5_DREPO|nr:hypothetical protein DPMN_034323 [Dreissena polymorpha]
MSKQKQFSKRVAQVCRYAAWYVVWMFGGLWVGIGDGASGRGYVTEDDLLSQEARGWVWDRLTYPNEFLPHTGSFRRISCAWP